MRRSSLRPLLFLVPWLAAGCTADAPPEDETPVDPATLPAFARDMLDAHNAVRAGTLSPMPSPPLEPLTWDRGAEAVAREYAEKCVFRHNEDRGTYGENLAAASPDYWSTADVVREWAKEAQDYDYANNACSGPQCGHYTQVVWRGTKRVGCATQTCTKNSPFGSQAPTWQLWVCNYAPPGNYVGQRPY
jgi:uncharacterized protein YkwD